MPLVSESNWQHGLHLGRGQLNSPSGFSEERAAMKSVDCVHVIQQKDTASSPSAPPGAASGTTGLFSVTFLWLAMLLSSCLAAVSLYHVITLKTELEALRSEVIYRVHTRSLLDRPPVSPDENKAGTPVSSFRQVSAAGARQVRWRGSFWLAGGEQMRGCFHWLTVASPG